MAAPQGTHEILILGTHHSGINTAHYLLRHVLPKLATLSSTTYHVTLVGPNTEFFWNIAAPRHLVSEKLIPSEQIYLSITDAFKAYDSSKYTIIHGKASALNPDNKTVTITTNSKETKEITYSSLVIATGASYQSPVWQVNDTDNVTKSEFASFRSALQSAKTVLIAGGGAVGVETAGEIGAQFPNVQTTLLSGGTSLLPRLNASNQTGAVSKLKALGVVTEHNVKVKSHSKSEGGTTNVLLDNGEARTMDVYIDATGGKPNSQFLPKSWLDERGYVLTDPSTLRASFSGGEHIYAIGDVASYSDGSLIAANGSIVPVGTSIAVDLAKAAGKEAESGFKQKLYKAQKGTQIVPIGPGGGVGQVFGWGVPSFMVWLIKSRNYFVPMAQGAVGGANAGKA